MYLSLCTLLKKKVKTKLTFKIPKVRGTKNLACSSRQAVCGISLEQEKGGKKGKRVPASGIKTDLPTQRVPCSQLLPKSLNRKPSQEDQEPILTKAEGKPKLFHTEDHL